jgi:hypothetical protein
MALMVMDGIHYLMPLMDGINWTALMDGINGNGRHSLMDGFNGWH